MVPRLNAENRLTPEDEFFSDLPSPTPRKHFIENIPTRLPEASARVCTLCRISACGRQRTPDTRARRGWAPGELPGPGSPRGARRQPGAWPRGQVGQSRQHLPASRRGWASTVRAPQRPAHYTRRLFCKEIWFVKSMHRLGFTLTQGRRL